MRVPTHIYVIFGLAMSLMVTYFALAKKESFYGMSPGTLDQLASTHVPSGLPGMNRRF